MNVQPTVSEGHKNVRGVVGKIATKEGESLNNRHIENEVGWQN